MLPTKSRRKVAPSAAENGDSAEKLDQLLLSSAICNGEDVGPFVRKAFTSGKPETLLQHLRHFSRSKESEIEEVCKAHYQDFILAVDDLRSLISDVDSLNRPEIIEKYKILERVGSRAYSDVYKAIRLSNNLSAKFAALKSSPPVDLSIISAQSHGLFQLSKARHRFNGSDSSHSLSVLDG
ncbi:hypothetical protein ACFX2J_003215 [Malus domestica]